MARPDIAITGVGAVSAAGTGAAALGRALAEGLEGIGPIERFSTAEFPVGIAGVVRGWPEPVVSDDDARWRALCESFAIAAAREALADARAQGAAEPARVALVMGTTTQADHAGPDARTRAVARALDVRGPCLTVATACSASTAALGLARDLVESGEADLALAGGADALAPATFAGFHALGVLCPGPCAPFSFPVGATMGEGAAFLVLETAARAAARGVAARAVLAGYGLSGDAHHETAPDPSGGGVARAIHAALADAGLAPDDVGYVNAHGTGTEANDAAEWQALRRVFGERAATLPVSSTKGHLGHALGAAGALEAVATLLCLERGTVPPTLHFTRPRPRGPADPVAGTRSRPHAWRWGVSTNSAFSGSNAAVVLGRGPAPTRERPARTVRLLGGAAVGPHGTDAEAFARAFDAGAPCRGRVPDLALERIVPGAEARHLDPSAVYLTAAAALALADAGVALRGAGRDRAGLVIGANRRSARSSARFRGSIATRGLARLDASAFTRRVLNASAGSCSKLLSLRGPACTLSTGPGAGLVAIVQAVSLLRWRDDSDLLVAGAFDELADFERPEELGEGAACVVLGAGEAPGVRGAAPVAAGWALAGPGDAAGAVARALGRAGLCGADVDAVYGTDLALPGLPPARDPQPVFGRSDALASALALVRALRAVRDGEARVAVTACGGDGLAAAALVLTGGGG